jgi:uncharacterized protein YxeA
MKNITKKIVIGLVIILFFAIAVIFYFRYTENKSYTSKGNELIEKVEEYKQKNGELPETVSDLGIIETMGEGPYYEKIDSLNYIVFFNIGFDNRKIYYSHSKKWLDEP